MIQEGPGYHEIDGRKPDAAQTAADEAEQLDFRGGKNTLAATLPHCRGKLGLKHLELATAGDAWNLVDSQGWLCTPGRLRSAFLGVNVFPDYPDITSGDMT